MSQIDVLAVMDVAINDLNALNFGESGKPWSGEAGLREARAAVAELIEAAKEREAAHRELIENIPLGSECGVPAHIRLRYRAACERFDAALARVGSAP